jgi:hypothetical protein
LAGDGDLAGEVFGGTFDCLELGLADQFHGIAPFGLSMGRLCGKQRSE